MGHNEAQARYVAAHREEVRARDLARYRAHREERNAAARAKRIADRERYLAHRRTYEAARYGGKENGPRLIRHEEELGLQKRCTRCHEWWPWDEEFFRIAAHAGDVYVSNGRPYVRASNVLRSTCRACDAERRRGWRERLPGSEVAG